MHNANLNACCRRSVTGLWEYVLASPDVSTEVVEALSGRDDRCYLSAVAYVGERAGIAGRPPGDRNVVLCTAAGLPPVGVCCEVMNTDGTMAGSPDLRFHWGGAYLIEHLGPDVWVAQRRDKSWGTLGAKTPVGLLVKIRDDYAAQPVPRQRSGA